MNNDHLPLQFFTKRNRKQFDKGLNVCYHRISCFIVLLRRCAMKIRLNMGRAGGSEDVHVGPEKIAFLILERFIEMIRPEPPSLFTFKQITVTFEEIKAQVITRSPLY